MNVNQISVCLAERTEHIPRSVFREIANFAHIHDAINLSGGTPDFAPTQELQLAASENMQISNNHQYTMSQGTPGLRAGIAAKISQQYGMSFDPETEITICCGAVEAMSATLLAIVNPGDEVIIIEPAFPSYAASVAIGGGKPVSVKLRPPSFDIDLQELEAAVSSRTKAIILNTPHNPTGKVFSQQEIAGVADICLKYNVMAIVDEIYDNLIYDGLVSQNLWRVPGMRERTIIINGFSKTYTVTGWRIGYAIAAPAITKGIRLIHGHLTFCAPAPLQLAAEHATRLPDSYYQQLVAMYQKRRDFLTVGLEKIGFSCLPAQGGYFIVAGFENFGWQDDLSFAKYLIENVGVAMTPLSGFYINPTSEERKFLRATFCKKEETLIASLARLRNLQINFKIKKMSYF